MNDALKAKLREAWHTSDDGNSIADHFGVSYSTLIQFWWNEKKAGRLPQGRRAVARGQVKKTYLAGSDGERGLMGEPGIKLPTGDPLLAVLRETHSVPRADRPIPPAWLRTFPRRVNFPQAGLASTIELCECEPDPAELRKMRLRADLRFLRSIQPKARAA